MIPSLLLTSLTTFAMPVVISDVRATRESGHLRVEVRGDGGIDPETARTRIDGGRLILVLGGARVRADNRAWTLEDGVGEIRAHRHPGEVELEVPLSGNGCAGPVELQGTPTGMTALVGCDGAAPKLGARPPRAVARAATADQVGLEALVALPAGEPTPALGRAESAGSPKAAPREATVALPAPTKASAVEASKGGTAPAAKTTLAAPAKVAPAVVAAASADKPAAAEKSPAAPAAAEGVAAAALPAKPLLLPAPAAGTFDVSDKTGDSAPTRLRAVSLPAILLGGLALAAYLFARRRRLPKLKQIEILETASLGPKRSLIVARVGEETLVLGTSEAGITLLKSSGAMGDGIPMAAFSSALSTAMVAPVVAALPAVAAAVASAPTISTSTTTATVSTASPPPRTTRETLAFAPLMSVRGDDSGPTRVVGSAHTDELDQPLIEALADVPEPDRMPEPVVKGVTFRAIEGGLASLFGRGGAASNAGSGRAVAPTFDDILEDSLEDQELRRKLAAGMSARVR